MTEPGDPKPGGAAPKSEARVRDSIAPTQCKHVRKQLIAKDEDAEYWECMDCGEIYEPGEDGGIVNLDGSLSDA
jgi:hypothetical protein